jgi:hypothetical protein
VTVEHATAAVIHPAVARSYNRAPAPRTWPPHPLSRTHVPAHGWRCTYPRFVTFYVTAGGSLTRSRHELSHANGGVVVMTVLCVGCGRSLPERAVRGRPARYHGPVCRQHARRARRARLGVDPGLAALLAVAPAGRTRRRCATPGGDHHRSRSGCGGYGVARGGNRACHPARLPEPKPTLP